MTELDDILAAREAGTMDSAGTIEDLVDLIDASQEHIAALETTSRALAAKLEECGPYLPHGSIRAELDALIAVLKSSEKEG